MGDSHSIVDIARRYASLVGLGEPEIICTGARPGEKLDEELVGPGEIPRPTAHPAITAISVGSDGQFDYGAVQSLIQAAGQGASAGQLRASLADLAGVPRLEASR